MQTMKSNQKSKYSVFLYLHMQTFFHLSTGKLMANVRLTPLHTVLGKNIQRIQVLPKKNLGYSHTLTV